MLSRQFKCIFVHIPKTAGQSIARVFLQSAGLSWENRAPLLLRANDDPALGPPRLAHLTAAEYVTCGYVTPQDFASYFKFTFVRNPWDRIVSEYKYRGCARTCTFKSFLFHHLPQPNWSDAYRHVMPQYDFLHDARGTLLVDFVGHFETLQTDFDEVCRRLAIALTALPNVSHWPSETPRSGLARLIAMLWKRRPPKSSAGRRRCYTEYYDDETREFVADLYRKDVEAFGYSFGAAQARVAPSRSLPG